jgi:hypothetical protein
MPMEEEPVVGAMYEDEDGKAFEVLSFDEDDGTIEVQYEDGSVQQLDIDAWYEMDLEQLKSGTWKDADDDDLDDEDDDLDDDEDDEDDDDEDDDFDEDYEDER